MTCVGMFGSGVRIGMEDTECKVIRGGSWISGAQYLRPAYRIYGEPSYRNSFLGLRLVRTLNNTCTPNTFTLEEIKKRLKRYYFKQYKKALKEFEG